MGIKQSLRFKQQHKLPVVLSKTQEMAIKEAQLKFGEQDIQVNKDPKCVEEEPTVYMQPELAIQVHLGIFDFKLFQGLDFDFKNEKVKS